MTATKASDANKITARKEYLAVFTSAVSLGNRYVAAYTANTKPRENNIKVPITTKFSTLWLAETPRWVSTLAAISIGFRIPSACPVHCG